MKFKSVFRIDFVTNEEEYQYYLAHLKETGDQRKAIEELRKKYGYASVHFLASTQESALHRFHNAFPDGFWLNYECVVHGTAL